jgi:hypothetical protein
MLSRRFKAPSGRKGRQIPPDDDYDGLFLGHSSAPVPLISADAGQEAGTCAPRGDMEAIVPADVAEKLPHAEFQRSLKSEPRQDLATDCQGPSPCISSRVRLLNDL